MIQRKKALQKIETNEPIELSQYSYWQALYMSFYSSRLYVDVAKRWRGYGILYFLLLVMLATIPFMTRLTMDLNQYVKQLVTPIEGLPTLMIQKGQILFDKPMPYFIKNQQNEVVAMIDTTRKIDEFNPKYPKLMMILTKDKIYFRPPPIQFFFSDTPKNLEENQIKITQIDRNSNEVFSSKDLIAKSGIQKLKYLIQFILYPSVAMLIFSFYVTLLMMLAFIGLLFSIIIFQSNLKYKEVCRLFLVSSTPQVLMFFTLLTLHVPLPGGNFYNILLLAIYFNYALISVNRDKKKWMTV